MHRKALLGVSAVLLDAAALDSHKLRETLKVLSAAILHQKQQPAPH